MSVSRRSFMGVATGLLAAGKNAARLAGVSALGSPPRVSVFNHDPNARASTPGGGSSARVGWLRRQLAALDDRSRIVRHAYPPTRLDPDIAALRAFSLAAKMRIQRDRDLVRHIENRRAELLHEIAEAVAEEMGL